MKKYRIIILKKARKFILKQPPKNQIRILEALRGLPSTGDIKPIQGKSELYRLRVGDYRIIYSVEKSELIVYVVDANNRGQIYKNL